MIAGRFQVKRNTVSSWVYRKRVAPNSKESSKFVVLSVIPMKGEKLPIEAMEERIRELEQQLAKEKMRSTCLNTMIDIAERELKVDIRKKSGAKQSKK
ncbi:helix-turn-helix domain-containing protein [Bacteroides fragilis]|uniref:helix-turn-helix domain-containing protein n=1 Tax=Bacteroides fragilis TaxID=817 RepID=UPI002926296D|nr:transposase [Bacteroides fragilis]